MDYTTLATVKKLLQSTATIFPNIKNEKKTFIGYDKVYFQYTNLDINTEVIKMIRTTTLTKDHVTLNDYTKIDLSATLIVPNTVVVSDTLTLNKIYVENKDYIINYDKGKISRCTNGTTIPNHTLVYVWYIPFTQLNVGSDYNIDIVEGTMNRRAGTSIPDGAVAYADYSHSQGTVQDDLIEEVIDEVSSFMNNILKEIYLTQTPIEKAIESAATNYSLALISFAQANRYLKIGGQDSDSIAKEYNSLAESYYKTAEMFISPYTKTSITATPTHKINESSTFANRPPRFSFTAGRSAGKQ